MPNREILFRGKRKDNGEWVEGFYFENFDKCYIMSTKYLDNPITKFIFEVIPETVGQYIGLPDKKDKKIFEGDIVRERGGESYQGYYEIDNVLTVKIPDILVNFEMSYDCEYKIIGNIYDNPELIEAED